MSGDSAFLSRWARRKAQARQGLVPDEPATAPATAVPSVVAATPTATTAATAPAAAPSVAEVAPPPPAPTMADVAGLTRQSDFSRFVAPGVDGNVKNAALKKLFDDPHFNVMDGLDVYIDDYNKPDPLPLASLRKMAQAAFLGLIEAEPPVAAAATGDVRPPSTPISTNPPPAPDAPSAAHPGGPRAASDEDADLRLQPHDAAGRGGAEGGAAADPRREC